MKKYLSIIVALSFMFIILTGCFHSDTTGNFNTFYSKKHYKKISRIELSSKDGFVTLTDPKGIDDLMKTLEGLTFTNQRDTEGRQARYHDIRIFENDKLTFGLGFLSKYASMCKVAEDKLIQKVLDYDVDKDITEYLDKVIDSLQPKVFTMADILGKDANSATLSFFTGKKSNFKRFRITDRKTVDKFLEILQRLKFEKANKLDEDYEYFVDVFKISYDNDKDTTREEKLVGINLGKSVAYIKSPRGVFLCSSSDVDNQGILREIANTIDLLK